MELKRVLVILILLVLISSTVLSSTMARFTEEFSGLDSALVAKWNFGARGEDDIAGEFFNKGFTFDLFSAKSVEPMDFGTKSFTFTGGGSDVGILYDVEINAQDLLLLTTGTVAETVNVDVYAPFIFKITASINDGAVDSPPVVFSPPEYDSGWFRPGDIATDEDGYFSIFNQSLGKPYFSPGSEDQVTITVYWQWNTSCYINDTGAGTAVPDTSTEISDDYLPYYQFAYDQYYEPGGLEDRWKSAARAVDEYIDEHGSPSSDGIWEHYIDVPESEPILCEEDHFSEYNDLVDEEHDALNDCRTSLMTAYDDYDTLAAEALAEKESVKVIFRISGDQMAPE